MNMDQLTKAIKVWGQERGFDKAHPMGQLAKLQEELGELAGALIRRDREEMRDAIGDVYITLVNLAGSVNEDVTECVKDAYSEIKDRTGEMVNGVFVKDEK